jgi:hypothetical protein
MPQLQITYTDNTPWPKGIEAALAGDPRNTPGIRAYSERSPG